jgi:hypothetical protein
MSRDDHYEDEDDFDEYQEDERERGRRRRRRYDPERGTLILILGIVSVTICAPAGIAAWIMGKKDLEEIRAGRMDPAGESNTQIGYVLGIVGTCLFVLGLLILFIVLVVIAGLIAR